MGEPGVGEKLARRAVILVMDQNPARQHAERALDDAHVLVQHQMMDVGAIEPGADSRQQHNIVGPHQFPQLWLLLHGLAARVNRLMPLPHHPALSIVIAEDRLNCANVETGVAVIVPFESHSTASIDQLVGLVAADMERVNATILSRTGSGGTTTPAGANHLSPPGGEQ